jgi:hypothetical protein
MLFIICNTFVEEFNSRTLVLQLVLPQVQVDTGGP